MSTRTQLVYIDYIEAIDSTRGQKLCSRLMCISLCTLIMECSYSHLMIERWLVTVAVEQLFEFYDSDSDC